MALVAAAFRYQRISSRWYLYLGHLASWWSIVDVTDPANTSSSVHSGTRTWTIQMEFHDNLLMTALSSFARIGKRSTSLFKRNAVLGHQRSGQSQQIGQWKTGASASSEQLSWRQMRVWPRTWAWEPDSGHPRCQHQERQEVSRWWMQGQAEQSGADGYLLSWARRHRGHGKTAYLGWTAVVILDLSRIYSTQGNQPARDGTLNRRNRRPASYYRKNVLFANSETATDVR